MGKKEKRCNEDERFKGLGGLTYEEREIKIKLIVNISSSMDTALFTDRFNSFFQLSLSFFPSPRLL